MPMPLQSIIKRQRQNIPLRYHSYCWSLPLHREPSATRDVESTSDAITGVPVSAYTTGTRPAFCKLLRDDFLPAAGAASHQTAARWGSGGGVLVPIHAFAIILLFFMLHKVCGLVNCLFLQIRPCLPEGLLFTLAEMGAFCKFYTVFLEKEGPALRDFPRFGPFKKCFHFDLDKPGKTM